MQRRELLQSTLSLDTASQLPGIELASGSIVPEVPLPEPAVPVAGDRLVLNVKGIDYPFRWCPAGTFLMGSPPTEAERRDAGCSGDFVSTDIVSLAGQ